MSTHLTEEQISRWIAGDSIGQEQRHIQECVECAAKCTSFQNTVSQFRGLVTDWADQPHMAQLRGTAELLGALRRGRGRPLHWLAVAAAAVITVAIPAYRKSIESLERAREMEAARESQLDAQLLERVNAHLAQRAPISLQPLMLSNVNDVKNEGDHR